VYRLSPAAFRVTCSRFQDRDGRRQISTQGGCGLAWFKSTPALDAGKPQVLFERSVVSRAAINPGFTHAAPDGRGKK
jgi:hypothetical protein